MKKAVILLVIIVVTVFAAGNALSAIYTIEAQNLPGPSEIETLTLFFNVGDSFDYIQDSLQLGQDIPPNQPLDTFWPWTFTYSNPIVKNGVFTVDLYNSDSFDFNPIPNLADGKYNENNLVDGILASFEYSGQISLENFVVTNSIGGSISYLLTPLENDGGLILSAVPIPSAILLLGGGLLGMLGIRRKLNR